MGEPWREQRAAQAVMAGQLRGATMHVAHRSPDLLVVEHCPKTIGTLLIALATGGPFLLLRVVEVEGLGPMLLAVFMVDFPLLVIFTVAVRRLMIVLDRRRGRLALHERSLFRHRWVERPLGTLVRAERETNPAGIPFLPDRSHYHRAVLVLAENRRLTRVPVTSVFLIGPSGREVARTINGWLGRPLDSDTPAA